MQSSGQKEGKPEEGQSRKNLKKQTWRSREVRGKQSPLVLHCRCPLHHKGLKGINQVTAIEFCKTQDRNLTFLTVLSRVSFSTKTHKAIRLINWFAGSIVLARSTRAWRLRGEKSFFNMLLCQTFARPRAQQGYNMLS